ncbi:hypothetical protein PoB_005059400 [Plakobranchus ocellatus]|uniref:Uncharacterized protein n=1 Tax=Plakobranchus ocellatus TaxID=259542 RepID=A0AAV4C083_9GAST|nr:hypothetical protein PoB_005059400 [Plakobranchus ocellatus]
MATRRRRLRKRRRTTAQKSDLSRPSSSSSGSVLPMVHRPIKSSDKSLSLNANVQSGRESKQDAGTFDPDSDPYHAHLHSSLQAFRARKWRPLTPDQVPQPVVTRCRPFSLRPRSSLGLRATEISSRPCTPAPPSHPSQRRPCSASDLLLQKRSDTPLVNHGPFDMLSPRVLAHLVTDPRPLTPLSTYGDVIDDGMSRRKKKKAKGNTMDKDGNVVHDGKRVKDAETETDPSHVDGNEGGKKHANGIARGELENDTDDDDSSSSEDDDDDDDNDSISELERGKEPPVDKNRRAPDLHLRPERLDHIYTPENKRDYAKRFDFDASKCEIPAYEFESPVGPPYNKINFRLHAREGTDWRHTNYAIGADVPSDLVAMFDRLLEMEKRQIETEEWEDKRMKQVATAAAVAAARRRAASRRLASGKPIWRGAGAVNTTYNNSFSGGWDINSNCNSSSSNVINSKRCCHSCLQQACVGDCPEKRMAASHATAVCSKCHQTLCTGTCSETQYDQRMRQPRGEVDAPENVSHAKYPGHKNCKSCQRRHNAKFINANNLVLGRPSSAFATFSRGKGSAKPKDLRPKSALDLSDGLSKGIEKLGIDPLQPIPPTSEKPPRPHSRAGLIPGKTYHSNLSRSLTELSSKRRRSAKAKKKVSVPSS